MCTALAVSGPGFALAASDSRHVIDDVTYRFTGRTRRIPGGWVAVSGDAAIALRGLRELEVSGVAGAEAAIEKAVRECAMQREPNSPSRFLIAADTGELLDIVTGRAIERVPAPRTGMSYVVQPPPGLADNGQQAAQTMLGALSGAKTLEAMVRALAGFVHDCHAQGGRLSDECEIGVTIGGDARYCHRPARELANATDAEIGRAFVPPPALPAFPYLASEQLVFSLRPIEV